MTDRLDKLKSKLQALRAKTVANGCTEAEALAAAAKVAELLDRFDLSLGDLELRASPCVQIAVETRKKQRQPIAACVPAIADYCDCKAWREKDDKGRVRHVFFGLQPGVEAAQCLYELIAAAMQDAWERFAASQRFIRYGQDEKGSFLIGMAVSIADKLSAMKAERDDANRRGGGRDLVIVRHDVVEAEFAKLGMNFREGGPSGKAIAAAAFDAGQDAGARLAINGRPGPRC